MPISFPGISYNNAIKIANMCPFLLGNKFCPVEWTNIPRLEDYHKNICTKVCNEINNNKNHVFHELMAEGHQPPYPLRKSRQFNSAKTKTKRFNNSFIIKMCRLAN